MASFRSFKMVTRMLPGRGSDGSKPLIVYSVGDAIRDIDGTGYMVRAITRHHDDYDDDVYSVYYAEMDDKDMVKTGDGVMGQRVSFPADQAIEYALLLQDIHAAIAEAKDSQADGTYTSLYQPDESDDDDDDDDDEDDDGGDDEGGDDDKTSDEKTSDEKKSDEKKSEVKP